MNVDKEPGWRDIVWISAKIPDITQGEIENFVEGVGKLTENDSSPETEAAARGLRWGVILRARGVGSVAAEIW